jgi:ADP-ribose pyrophosphatase YjhB (NUDIX family)
MTGTDAEGDTDSSSALPQRLRISAYAVCLRQGTGHDRGQEPGQEQVLLARWVPPDDGTRLWTMPGGGLDHGEDPVDGVIREVWEETGYQVEVERLIGIDSVHRRAVLGSGTQVDFHALRIVYTARVVGGQLRHEVDGSTDRAEWFGLETVSELDRVDLVDTALALHRTAPPQGRLRTDRAG